MGTGSTSKLFSVGSAVSIDSGATSGAGAGVSIGSGRSTGMCFRGLPLFERVFPGGWSRILPASSTQKIWVQFEHWALAEAAFRSQEWAHAGHFMMMGFTSSSPIGGILSDTCRTDVFKLSVPVETERKGHPSGGLLEDRGQILQVEGKAMPLPEHLFRLFRAPIA